MARSPQKISGINGPVAAALAVWLGVQVAALGLSALRVRFWARSPLAGEQLGLFVMLAAQVGTASLLFPLLLNNLRSTLIAVATAWPFAELAAFLADVRGSRWIAGEVYVSVWLVTLYLWSGVLRNSWARLFATAVAAMLSLGGPVLWYLHSEFGNGGQITSESPAWFGPIAGAISLTIPDSIDHAWKLPAMLFASGAIARAAKRIQARKFRDKLSTRIIHKC
jgi:hypothetical protein